MRLFIVVRDRISNLPQLCEWGTAAGLHVVVVDNASTYPPLRELLAHTGVEVVRLRLNQGHTAPWTAGLVAALPPGEDYLVTDPDIEPPDLEPAAVVTELQRVLARYPELVKVGIGLRIDDLPACYALREQVIAWESRHWSTQLEPGVFDAPVDTTLALWRAGSVYCHGPAARTGPPYAGRHLDWYIDSANPSEELVYYRRRAGRWVSHWGHTALGEEKLAVLEGRPHRRAWRWREGLRRRVLTSRIALDRVLRR